MGKSRSKPKTLTRKDRKRAHRAEKKLRKEQQSKDLEAAQLATEHVTPDPVEQAAGDNIPAAKKTDAVLSDKPRPAAVRGARVSQLIKFFSEPKQYVSAVRSSHVAEIAKYCSEPKKSVSVPLETEKPAPVNGSSVSYIQSIRYILPSDSRRIEGLKQTWLNNITMAEKTRRQELQKKEEVLCAAMYPHVTQRRSQRSFGCAVQ